MASDFDLLRRKLAKAIHTGDCKSARVLGAKLQFAARTPAERGAVHRAQSRLRSCVTGLSGTRGGARRKKAAKSDRLFIGVFPTGISYADKARERDGDYMTIARLPFETLELEWAPGKHPPELRRQIERSARAMAKRRGEQFQVSAAGQTVTLGRRHRQGLSGNGLVRFLSSKSTRAPMNREGLTLREWVNAARFGTNIHGEESRTERAAWRAGEDPTDFYRR